jgi:hypothetical protein
LCNRLHKCALKKELKNLLFVETKVGKILNWATKKTFYFQKFLFFTFALFVNLNSE